MRQSLNQAGVILLMLGLMVTIGQTFLVNPVFADESGAVKKPKVRLSPEIPIESDGKNDNAGWFGKYKWWIALGVTTVAGALGAMAASSGGSDAGGGRNVDDDTSPTQYQIDW